MVGSTTIHAFPALTPTPRWNRNGGIWQSVPTNSHTRNLVEANTLRMVRLKPALSNICEPLLGSSSRDANGKVSASYPILSDRHRIYREGIEVLIVFEDPTDAITLAMYRRQVTCWGDIPDDRLFLLVADTLQLTDYAWLDIAVRMPMGSCIRRASFMRAYGYRPEGVTAIAAE